MVVMFRQEGIHICNTTGDFLVTYNVRHFVTITIKVP